MTTIRGAEAHRQRLRNMLMTPTNVERLTQALYVGAKDIADDAALSITAGAVSGKNHVPSAPGEPPNADTNVLANSIEGKIVGPLKAETSADAPYAAAQEFGSESIGLPERPYLRPATARMRPGAIKRVIRVVNQIIKATGAGRRG